jgi:cell division septation protein DedD
MAASDSDKPTGELGDLFDPLAEEDMKINLLPPQDAEEGGGRTRRLLIIAGLGVLLIGGAYLGNRLFLAPAEPPAPMPPMRPAPVAKAPAPAPAATTAPAPGPGAPAAKAPEPAKAPAAPGPAAKAPEPAKAPAPGPAAKAPVPGPAAKAPASGPPLTPAPAPAAKAPEAAKPAAPAKPAPAPGAATLARTTEKPRATAASYSVQVGALALEENARRLRQKLETDGFPARIKKGSAFLQKHVVTVGDPTGRREAEELARRLNVDGFPSQIAAADGKFAPQVGAFVNLDEAIDLAREVQKKQYRPKITSRPVTAELYQVRHGEFESRAAAVKRGEELKAKGFSVYVVPN